LFLFASAGSFDQLLRAGLAALNANDLPAAQSQLEAATKADPRRPQAWVALAQTYFKLKKPELANSAALRAESLVPADPVILQGLAFFYSETGNFDKVVALIRQALAQQDRAEFHDLLAKAYAATGKADETVAELQAAVRMRPYEETYYFELSQQLLRMQKFEAALQAVEKGIKLFDKSAQLELARGVALYGLRRFTDAIDSFLRTIQLAPEVEQPYVFLGRMLDIAEDRTPAITEALATYAQAQPDRYMSSFLYAKALAASGGNADRIEPLLRKSIALRNDFWESHFELGLVLERKHAFDQAAKELERSIELEPNQPVPHYRLARLYDRLGKTSAADEQRKIHARLAVK
jgi:tetratricopeptide (TPR) repeat protein